MDLEFLMLAEKLKMVSTSLGEQDFKSRLSDSENTTLLQVYSWFNSVLRTELSVDSIKLGIAKNLWEDVQNRLSAQELETVQRHYRSEMENGQLIAQRFLLGKKSR